jgi:hypothetical protein
LEIEPSGNIPRIVMAQQLLGHDFSYTLVLDSIDGKKHSKQS